VFHVKQFSSASESPVKIFRYNAGSTLGDSVAITQSQVLPEQARKSVLVYSKAGQDSETTPEAVIGFLVCALQRSCANLWLNGSHG
jgi:hypothetical protein